MAKIWPVYSGNVPTRGHPWLDLPFQEAQLLFKVEPSDRISALDHPPRFDDQDRDLWFRGYRHVVLEVGDSEVGGSDWQSGFYLIHRRPKEVFDLLLQHALGPSLGKHNVVRVFTEAATGSEGQGAIRVNVVIHPGAVEKLAKNGTLNALGSVQERLSEMGDDRTPTLSFTTEEELAADASS